MPLKIGKYVTAASRQPASTIFLRPMRSDSQPNTTKNGVPISSAAGDQIVGGLRVDLEHLRRGRTGRRTARAYHTTACPAVAPNSARITSLQIGPARERLRRAAPWRASPALHLREHRRFLRAAAGCTPRSPAARSRPGTGCASPRSRTHRRAACGVKRITSRHRNSPSVAVVWIQLVYRPRLPGRRVLGDVGRRAAVLAAERQALQQPQRDQQDRRGDADGGIARQHADEGGATGP